MSAAGSAPGGAPLEIPPERVREEIAKILASKFFANAPRANKFLSYIADRTLKDPTVYLSEFEIAVEVFGKNEKTFDARIDNDVRVGASRLRDRLERYYKADGVADAILVEVPPGGFKPVFSIRSIEPPPPPPLPPPPPRPLPVGPLALAVLAALLRMAVPFIPPPPPPLASRVAVLLFASPANEPEMEKLSQGLTARVTSSLAQIESLWVVPGEDVVFGGVQTVGQARVRYHVDLVVTGRVERQGEVLLVTINVNNAIPDPPKVLNSHQVSTEGDVAVFQNLAVKEVAELLAPHVVLPARTILLSLPVETPAAKALYEEGNINLDRGVTGTDSAIKLYERALEADSKFAPAHAGLCMAYVNKYDHQRDPQWLNGAQRSCERASGIDSNLAPVRVALGMLRSARGKHEEAITEFHFAQKLDPRSVKALYGLARAYERRGRDTECEDALREAIRIRPGYWRGYKELGLHYYRRGRYAEAAGFFEQALDRAPDNPELYSNLSGVYIQLGRLDEAVKIAREESSRGYANAHNNLSAAYYYQGRYAESLREMQEAARLASERDARVLGDLAHAYRWAGDDGRAREHYREAIRLAVESLDANPTDSALRAELAFYYADARDAARATAEIRKALDGAPRDSDVLYRAILVYEMTGDRDKALGAVKQMLAQGPLRGEVRLDPDLAKMRADPRYQTLPSGPAAGLTK